jgi:hypothetical protein
MTANVPPRYEGVLDEAAAKKADAASLKEAKEAILAMITEKAASIGASHRVLHLAEAYALLNGTSKPRGTAQTND